LKPKKKVKYKTKTKMTENILNRGKQDSTGIQNFGWRAAAAGLMPLAAARPCAAAEGH